MECQLPNSFTAGEISPTAKKDWQTTDPEGRHYVAIDRDGTASFDCRVQKRKFVGGDWKVFFR